MPAVNPVMMRMGFVLRQETREPYRRASAVFERPVDVLRRSSRHRPLRRWRSSLAWSWISHVPGAPIQFQGLRRIPLQRRPIEL